MSGAQIYQHAVAVGAIGLTVHMEPKEFVRILQRSGGALVVHSKETKWFQVNYSYLTSYRGLVFFTNATTPLQLPSDTELIQAKTIWVPFIT